MQKIQVEITYNFSLDVTIINILVSSRLYSDALMYIFMFI